MQKTKTKKTMQPGLQMTYAVRTLASESFRDNALKEAMLEMSFQRRAEFYGAPKARGGLVGGRDLCVQRCRKDVEKLCLFK